MFIFQRSLIDVMAQHNWDKSTLKNKKVLVLVETEYIHDEITLYQEAFTSLGASVTFASYLWGNQEHEIVSDVDRPDGTLHTMKVDVCVSTLDPNDFNAIICAANYVAVRLREIPPMHSLGTPEQIRQAPAVRFFAEAMKQKNIVKGALCHALWILTPCPELLRDRKVICHTVVLADILNAGATFVPEPSRVVVDDDLVTGRSADNLEEFFVTLVETILQKS
ncbi:MAG: DJ-1/PfpI family protein [Planctomycetaceae bacterium]|jgi:protease I|nr:DJ-1/PfpI family protein [Planctomycetaceae bacterium]